MDIEKIEHRKAKEIAVLGLTFARLLLAENIARRTENGKSSVFRMGLFVGADVADGVLARKWGVDTPVRRFADAATDRLSVLRIGKAVFDTNPESRTNLTILAARELVVGIANTYHLVQTGEVVQGHGIHKLGTLSIACFGVATNVGSTNMSRLAGATSNFINAGLAIDYVTNALHPHGSVVDGVRHIEFDNFRSPQT